MADDAHDAGLPGLVCGEASSDDQRLVEQQDIGRLGRNELRPSHVDGEPVHEPVAVVAANEPAVLVVLHAGDGVGRHPDGTQRTVRLAHGLDTGGDLASLKANARIHADPRRLDGEQRVDGSENCNNRDKLFHFHVSFLPLVSPSRFDPRCTRDDSALRCAEQLEV